MLYILFSTDVFVVNLLIDNVKILLPVMIENEALFVIAVPKTIRYVIMQVVSFLLLFVFLLVILYYLDWIIL